MNKSQRLKSITEDTLASLGARPTGALGVINPNPIKDISEVVDTRSDGYHVMNHGKDSTNKSVFHTDSRSEADHEELRRNIEKAGH